MLVDIFCFYFFYTRVIIFLFCLSFFVLRKFSSMFFLFLFFRLVFSHSFVFKFSSIHSSGFVLLVSPRPFRNAIVVLWPSHRLSMHPLPKMLLFLFIHFLTFFSCSSTSYFFLIHPLPFLFLFIHCLNCFSCSSTSANATFYIFSSLSRFLRFFASPDTFSLLFSFAHYYFFLSLSIHDFSSIISRRI